MTTDAPDELPEDELKFRYVRSSGPGGQNVNKVNSKAELRWDVVASQWYAAAPKARFLSRYASRITLAGELIITSDEYRDQAKNAAACRSRLLAMIKAVAVPPKARRATKPTRASQARRLTSKRLRSDVKQSRQQQGRSRSGEE